MLDSVACPGVMRCRDGRFPHAISRDPGRQRVSDPLCRPRSGDCCGMTTRAMLETMCRAFYDNLEDAKAFGGKGGPCFNRIVPAVMAKAPELSASNHHPKALPSLANGPRVFLHRVIHVFPATRGYTVLSFFISRNSRSCFKCVRTVIIAMDHYPCSRERPGKVKMKRTCFFQSEI
jgi:hypothetical protein